MRVMLALVMVSSACSFGGSNGGDDRPDARPNVDAPPRMDAGPDAMPIDAPPPPCVPGFVNLCVETVDPRTMTVSDAMSFDTGGGGCTKVLTQQGGPDICLVFVNRIEITGTGTLTAFGPRALALAAKEQLIIDGRIDVSARRQPARMGAGSLADTAAACAFATIPDPEEQGGGGGGAGGTYGTQGGAGGIGDLDTSTPNDGNGAGGTPGQAVAFSVLRGGCPGQQGAQNSGAGGSGGAGGGALYLSSPIIRINATGSVLAAGAGGANGDATNSGGGGGGGGSGGLILMQGANVTVTGTLRATGGGGGQGGSSTSLGEPGQDGAEPTGVTAALGGDQQVNGGNGGNGGAAAGAGAGDDDNFAGGGGGGGNGIVRILSAAATLTGGQIAPTATVVP